MRMRRVKPFPSYYITTTEIAGISLKLIGVTPIA